jgi:hypothetical protein
LSRLNEVCPENQEYLDGKQIAYVFGVNTGSGPCILAKNPKIKPYAVASRVRINKENGCSREME